MMVSIANWSENSLYDLPNKQPFHIVTFFTIAFLVTGASSNQASAQNTYESRVITSRLEEIYRNRFWIRNDTGEFITKTRSWLAFEDDQCTFTYGRIDYCFLDASDDDAASCKAENFHDLHSANEANFSYLKLSGEQSRKRYSNDLDLPLIPLSSDLEDFLISNCEYSLNFLEDGNIYTDLVNFSVWTEFPADERASCTAWLYENGEITSDAFYDVVHCNGEENEEWSCQLTLRSELGETFPSEEKSGRKLREVQGLWTRLASYCKN